MSITLDLSRVSNAPAVKAPVNLSGLTRAGLRQALVDAGVCPPEKAKMRASQVWSWIHHYGVTDFAAMSNVAKDMQAKLAEHFTLARPEVVERQVSKDGTRKWLIRTAPGIEIETVYIPDVGRAGALCVSSQVGCTLNCTFCHTGTQKLVRNLTAAEIVAQVQVARDDLGEWPSPKEDRRLSNIVFMGMGEPLYNLDHVSDAIDIISDNEGIALSRRRITVSTSGVVPQLQALGDRTAAMLAISLHATNDPLRDVLVPLNKKYPLDQLMAAIRAYPGLSKRAPGDVRIRHAEGRQRQPRRGARPVEADRGHSGQDQSDPVQPLAGRRLRMLGLEDHRALRRHPEQGRLRQPHPHAARPRHPGRLRTTEVRKREGQGLGAQEGGAGGGSRSGLTGRFLAACGEGGGA